MSEITQPDLETVIGKEPGFVGRVIIARSKA
jgi:hypothetical protein